MPSFKSVAVIGAGAWGTALAGVAARAGREVVLCARKPDSAARDRRDARQSETARRNARCERRRHRRYRAGRERRHHPDRDAGAESARGGRRARRRIWPGATPVIACAKGIERGTHQFMTEVIAEAAPDATPAILSGPSFADDVARGLPTAVTLAAQGRSSLPARWCRRWARRPSGPITPPTSAASRSAARPRTCWRSPPASWSAASSAPRRRRR